MAISQQQFFGGKIPTERVSVIGNENTIVKNEQDSGANSYFKNVMQDYSNAGNRIVQGVKDSADTISKGFSTIGQGNIKQGVTDIVKGEARAGLRTVGSVAGAAFAPINEIPGIKSITEGIGNAVAPAIQSDTMHPIVSKLQELTQKYPEATKDITDIVNIATLGLGGEGEKLAKTAITDAQKSVADFIPKIEPLKVPSPMENFSSDTMTRVARIPKAAQSKFEQLTGDTVGKYLVDRNIYGDQDQIATQLFNRFTKSKNVADEAFAKLPGQYQNGAIKDALNELVSREKRVSSPNVESPDLRRAIELQNKHNTVGLTMSETNEAKRLFERNVKTGYFKEMNADAIARSTNIDQALRDWQFKQAEQLGLDNIGVVNKETQAAKQLLDAMSKEIAGVGGNNAVSLTDWIVLSGSPDPATAIASYFGKKALSNKKLQSFIAKFFAPEATKETIVAPIGDTRFPRLPVGETKNPTITKPLELPAQTQSTLDATERANLAKQPSKSQELKLLASTQSSNVIPNKSSKLSTAISDLKSELKNNGQKGSAQLIKVTEPLKDSVSKEIANLDTKVLTVNGKPDLSNSDTQFRLSQLQDIVNKRALTSSEVQEAIPLLKKVGIDVQKEINPLIAEAKKYKSADEFVKSQPVVYHGSNTPLKQFSNKQGTFFTDDYMNADGYASGENVYEGHLNLKKPLIIDAKEVRYDNLKTQYGTTTQEIVGNVDNKKYDGVIFKNIKDSFSDAEEIDQVPGTIYYAFKPKDSFLNESQLKDIWKQAHSTKNSTGSAKLGTVSKIGLATAGLSGANKVKQKLQAKK